MKKASILKMTGLAMRLCVPGNFTEEQIVEFAENKNPCGTSHGWELAKEGHLSLEGNKDRIMCAGDVDNVHVVVIA